MLKHSQIIIIRLTKLIFFLLFNSKKPFRRTKFISILNYIQIRLAYYYFHLQTLLSFLLNNDCEIQRISNFIQ